MKCPATLLRLFRAREGIAFVEFAITLPFLLLLFMGAVEVTRYIIVVQKVEKAAITLSDLVAQASETTGTELNVMMLAAGQVILPYSFDANGYAIVSSVTRTGSAAPLVSWQFGGGGTWVQPSQIGAAGSVASMPPGFLMNSGENVIVAEVFYNYTPLFATAIMPGGLVYKRSLFRPRLGDLTSLGS